MSVLSFFKKRSPEVSMVAVGMTGTGVGLARVTRGAGESPVLDTLAFMAAQGEQEQGEALRSLVRENGLEGARCTGLLQPEAYSLLLTEAPDVPPEEMREAMRWRVKDLVDFDISDAVIDLFEVPGHKVASDSSMVYVVVAPDGGVRKHADSIQAAGLSLVAVDVPELALRNLASLMPEDVSGTAVLWTNGDVGLINLTRQGTLHLARRFPLPISSFGGQDPQHLLDSLVIEVQRSTDYYDSHFSLPPISHLVVAPMPLPGVSDYLASQLGLATSDMELGRLVDPDVEISAELEIRCTSLVGAALREWDAP